jgi:hypothetical protein
MCKCIMIALLPKGAFSPHHWEYLRSPDIRRYRLQTSQVGSRSAFSVENGP